MKLLIASDIHGSAYWCRKLLARIDEEVPDKIVLLGDLLYHGSRNDLSQEYSPKQVCAMLNPLASRIVAVRGNCDSEVDQMVLDFPCMADYAFVLDGVSAAMRTIFCTHGHLFGPDNMPPLPAGSALLSGHTHVKGIAMRNGITCVNPGSVSLPKDGSNSYALYENGTFHLCILT